MTILFSEKLKSAVKSNVCKKDKLWSLLPVNGNEIITEVTWFPKSLEHWFYYPSKIKGYASSKSITRKKGKGILETGWCMFN